MYRHSNNYFIYFRIDYGNNREEEMIYYLVGWIISMVIFLIVIWRIKAKPFVNNLALIFTIILLSFPLIIFPITRDFIKIAPLEQTNKELTIKLRKCKEYNWEIERNLENTKQALEKFQKYETR